MKKIITLLLVCVLLLSSCTAIEKPTQKEYSATFLNVFDTVTKIVGTAESREAFEEKIQPIQDELERYHKLFDIYDEYDGIANLKTVNDKASIAPVYVDTAIIDLLQDCKEYYDDTNGVFNYAMGSVLQLWHQAREDGINDPENAYLPNADALKKASQHIDPNDIVLDLEKSTVFFKDPDLKIDVGAIAKGWSVQRACENAPEGLLLSVGGNVHATGQRTDGKASWSIGIQSPDSNGYLHTISIKKGSVVTSGSYIRTYAVDGKQYHHIIDPDTLYPGELWVSVTVVCDDSGLADVLSTSLFLLNQEKGQELLDKYNAKALWIDEKGNKYYSPGFRDIIKN